MSHPDAERLFALDAALRAEAEAMLADSGIGSVLQEAGYMAVGSYVMHTMVWRDLDFERHAEPDWNLHWQIGTRLAETGWCVRLQCIDVYREQWSDFGYYWGARVVSPGRSKPTPPGDPTVWKLDIWMGRPEEFSAGAPLRAKWGSLMTDELRSYVLAIKEAVWRDPEYRKSLLSVHIYEAVLEHGVRGVDEFRERWRAHYTETPGT